MTSAYAHTHVYTHTLHIYIYVSMLYSYVILNLYIHTLTYAPKIFVVQRNSCNFVRTYSFGLGEYV